MSAIKNMCGELYPLILENIGDYEQWPQHAMVIDDEYLAFNVFDYGGPSKLHSNRSKHLGTTVLKDLENENGERVFEINYVPGHAMRGIIISEQVFRTEPFLILTITHSREEPIVLVGAEGQNIEHGMRIQEQSAVLVALTTVVCEKIIDQNVQTYRDQILASAV
jgi:hypothetical protein